MEDLEMDNEKNAVKKENGLGTIRVADEVVSIIAGLATTEVEGVAGMSGGIAGGIAEILGRKNFSKGVKVEVGEKEAAEGLVSMRKQGGGEQATMTMEAFAKRINDEVAEQLKTLD